MSDSKPDTHALSSRAARELDELFDELDELLKGPHAGEVLAERGVNVSLAIVAADGLRAYLKGDKEQAAEELSTAADEIRARLAMARSEAAKKPS